MYIISLGFPSEEAAQEGFEQLRKLDFVPGTPHYYGYSPSSTAVRRDLVYACGNALDLIERLYEVQEFRGRIHKDLIDQLRIAIKRGLVEPPNMNKLVEVDQNE